MSANLPNAPPWKLTWHFFPILSSIGDIHLPNLLIFQPGHVCVFREVVPVTSPPFNPSCRCPSCPNCRARSPWRWRKSPARKPVEVGKNPHGLPGFLLHPRVVCFRISAIKQYHCWDSSCLIFPPKCSEWIPKMMLWKMYFALKCAYFEYLFVKFPWRSQIIGGKTCAEKNLPYNGTWIYSSQNKNLKDHRSEQVQDAVRGT